MAARAAGLALLAMLAAAPALAQPRVGLRVGDHPGHGRIVFDWPSETGYRVEERDGRAVLRFAAPAAFDLAAARRPPRNVRGIAEEGEAVVVTLAPGARLRHFRLGNRIVLDVLDAETAPARTEARAPAPAPRRAGRGSAPAPAPVAPPTVAAPAIAAAPVPPVVVEPLGPRLPRIEPRAAGLLIPAGPDVGAALLRRGETWLLVLDAPVPLDAASLREGAFARAELATGQHATVLRLPAASLAEPRLTRETAGWLLQSEAAPPALRSIRPELDPGPPPRLLLRAAQPASTLAVLDPEGGGTLLVGTLRAGGEATPTGRRAATFDILPTRLGAAILPRADSVTLRPLPQGFAAGTGPGGALPLGAMPGAESDAAMMSRLFDLPDEPLPALLQRERNATAEVAAAAPLARGMPRLRNAEALLALGLGAEAQTMATLAMREDPQLAEDPRARALAGAAALLAGRLAETEGLRHPRLPDSDEAALWRGLLAAARGEEAAAAIARGLPLLRAWPAPLRDRLMPLAAEALAAGGEGAAARRLLAGRDDDPAYALARARLLESEGAHPAALAAYDAVMRGRDRRARAIAMRRAAELRLASGQIDAAGAAAAMESVLAAWRGDSLESEARLRLAALRLEAGDARGAFAALRETEQLFPELAPVTRPRQAEALRAAIAREAPLAAVALFDSHAALLAGDAEGLAALETLAERLAALDLVARARGMLGQALARAPAGEARARIGLRLATLALSSEDAAGARTALAETAAQDLPAPLQRDRMLAEARALARLGAVEDAAARYRALGADAAPEHAEMLAQRQDWPAAAAVLRAHLAAALPAAPAVLDEAQRRLVARAAALHALAGDEAALATLRTAESGRMEGGAFADAFTLLTAQRIGGVADLPRLRQELDAVRALPARL
jgi:hypothetical protein